MAVTKAKAKAAKSTRRVCKSTAQRKRSTSAKAVVSRVAVAPGPRKKTTVATSKREAILTLLKDPAGATIAAIMEVTGWQQHSVRGFLAGVVRKKLELNLVSAKVGDQRVYRITKTGGR